MIEGSKMEQERGVEIGAKMSYCRLRESRNDELTVVDGSRTSEKRRQVGVFKQPRQRSERPRTANGGERTWGPVF